jgi:hypothetical protein
MIAPFPPPILVDQAPTESFDTIWQRWREGIGEYNEDYIDSQEKELWARHPSCEVLEEDYFYEGEYAIAKVRNLKHLWHLAWWVFAKWIKFFSNHIRGRGREKGRRKRRRGERILIGEKRLEEEEPQHPSRKPPSIQLQAQIAAATYLAHFAQKGARLP